MNRIGTIKDISDIIICDLTSFFLFLFVMLQKLMKLTQSKEDEDSLKQVVAMISPLQGKLQEMIQNADSSIIKKPK